MRSVLFIFCATSIFMETLGLKADVLSEFSPSLLRVRNLATAKYQSTTKEHDALIAQMKVNQNIFINNTATQITNIRTIIANAKKTVNITTAQTTCVTRQSTVANALATTTLNSCYSTTNVSLLSTTKSKFTTLSNVGLNTATYCNYLNPYETQVDAYEKCLDDKVSDLNRQINLLEVEYNQLSNRTLNDNIKCLTETSGKVLNQIGLISYEVNVCFFM